MIGKKKERWLTQTAGSRDVIELMEERFKLIANTVKPFPNAIQPLFNPVHREILRTCPIVDEWDKHTKPAQPIVYMPKAKKLYADIVPIECDDGNERWKCPYCGGMRTGDRCEGCGAPRGRGELTL